MKKRKFYPFLVLFVSVLLLSASFLAKADYGSEHSKPIREVLEEIRLKQGVQNNKSIDCRKISDEQFEEIGEAYMGVIHSDPRQHELMDNMMGGEGSKSLQAAHIAMGQKYLNCGNWNNYMTSVGMMGGGMMGGGMMGGGMMGNNFDNRYRSGFKFLRSFGMMPFGTMGSFGKIGIGLGFVFMILFWGLIILGVVALVRYLSSSSNSGEDPLDILAIRYAKGKLTRKKYEEMKKELK